MIRNYIKIAWRNVKKKPLFSIINILGLATGLACTFLIYMWVNDEMMTDRFHENDTRLYQIMEKSTENSNVLVHDHTQGPLAEALEKEFPEVEHAVTVMNLGKEGMEITLKNEDHTYKSSGIFTSPTFFDAFTFPFIEGDKLQALQEKNNVVVSEKLAKKLFGSSQNAVDKSVSYNLFGVNHVAKISGVFKDAPTNSTLKFDYVFTKTMLLEDIWTNGNEWGNTGPETYVLLKPNANVDLFEQKITNLIDTYQQGNIFSLFLRKFSDGYLYNNYENGIQDGGRITYVRLFSFIAILVLLIACINFMNLSTARVSSRFKEIGIKKVVGTSRRALMLQFLTESVFLSLFAMIIALAMVLLLTPAFNYITGKELSLEFSPLNIFFLLSLTLITGLLSGSYPAFYLSGFTPLNTLKGNFKGKGGELFIRKGLVVFQFMASIVLIISVLIINKQINYALDKPIGYNKNNIIHFDLEGKSSENIASFFSGLRNVPGVLDAGGINQTLIREDGGSSTYGVSWPGKKENSPIDFLIRGIDEHLMSTLGMKMETGSAFSDELGALDSYVLFNETAIKIMNLKNPVGTKINLWGEDKTILGVVKDFHTGSVMQSIPPLVFHYRPKEASMAMVSIKPEGEGKTLDAIKKFYEQYNSGYTFDFKFLDDTFQAQYTTEQHILKLASYFAYMAILISCLGLLGLAAFNAELRRKEIGIRKVLGSSSLGILKLLNIDFIKLVGLAILIAIPIAWFLMNSWLSQFVYKINISWWLFALAGVMVMLIALVTVSLQGLKAALTNPVKSLRTE